MVYVPSDNRRRSSGIRWRNENELVRIKSHFWSRNDFAFFKELIAITANAPAIFISKNEGIQELVSMYDLGWRYQSQHFRNEFCAPPSLRSKKMRAVHENRASRGTAESDQGEVWDEVAKCLDDMKAHSPTDSLTDGFEAAKEKLQLYREELPLPSSTAGVLMARGDQVVGMDLFDSPDTLQALWERLSDAYFFDALRNRRRRRKASRKSAQQFLQAITDRVKARVPALGLGNELEITGDGVVGAALLYSGSVCHISAFSDDS